MLPDEELRAGVVTRLLSAVRGGDRDALDRLIPIVYEELRGIARRHLNREYGERTLHATALVHEAYLKLVGSENIAAVDRAHFLAMMSRAMRQVLIDAARRRNAAKRGGGWLRATLSAGQDAIELPLDDLIALDAALEKLEPRQRQIVECRYFGGMEELEIAALLGVSDRTVRREWVKARAWLYRELYGGSPEPGSAE